MMNTLYFDLTTNAKRLLIIDECFRIQLITHLSCFLVMVGDIIELRSPGLDNKILARYDLKYVFSSKEIF